MKEGRRGGLVACYIFVYAFILKRDRFVTSFLAKTVLSFPSLRTHEGEAVSSFNMRHYL